MSDFKLKGAKGWACYQAYLSTIYYLPLTATYRDQKNMTREQILQDFKDKDHGERLKILSELYSVASISSNDMLNLVCVHRDNNGASYNASNIAKLDVPDVFKMVSKSISACADINTELFF